MGSVNRATLTEDLHHPTLWRKIMENPILAAIEAIKCHIANHTQIPEEMVAAEAALRADLKKLSKDDLIERIINMQLKRTVKVVQADLVQDILCDPACAILTYEEISETIKENLVTDQKYSVENLRWYKTNLQNVKGVEGILNRMPAKERQAIDRKLLSDMMKKAA